MTRNYSVVTVKHGVSFEEAETAFADENALLADPEHSETEDRFVLLGLSTPIRLLVVCHCYREKESGDSNHFGSQSRQG